MKSFPFIVLTFLFTFYSQNVICQTTWQESFSDSNFTSNPIWEGDTSKFIVNNDAQLKLDAPKIAGTAQISTASTCAYNASWVFDLTLLFNPSSSNYAEVFFISDKKDFSQPLNGYFVRIGGTTKDKVHLFKRTGFTDDLLLESQDDLVDENKVELSIKIERSASGYLKLFADTSSNFFLIDSVEDNSHLSSQYFGIRCNYTSSRSDKFILDSINVNGQIFVDKKPPLVKEARIFSTNELKIDFSEKIDSLSSRNLTSYLLFPVNKNPTKSSWNSLEPSSVLLKFGDDFDSGINQLFVQEIEDLFGNEIEDTTISFNYKNEDYRSVIFSEIMFDPSPQVGLPNHDYLELYNRSESDINLQDWTIEIGARIFEFPETYLKKDSFLILIPESSASAFSNINFLESNFPTNFLPLGGETIKLMNRYGKEIQEIEYDQSFYKDNEKDDGGWSIERMDNEISCEGPVNWEASKNPLGGTPGARNSQHIFNNSVNSNDVKYLVFKSSNQLSLVFEGSIAEASVKSSLPIESLEWNSNKKDVLEIEFSENMIDGSVYNLWIDNIQDCIGHSTIGDTMIFGIPKTPIEESVFLSEIMFNPKVGQEDFIEFYNSNNYCVSLSNFRTAELSEFDESPFNVNHLVTDSIIIEPRSYYVISENPSALKEEYIIGKNHHIIEVQNLNSLPSSEGSIGLSTASLKWMDYAYFNEGWHHPLISSAKGVSLERVSFSYSALSENNWHSASYSSGFATPALPNSQLVNGSSSAQITISPDVFTPDNNGYQDVLEISFSLDGPGWVLTLQVFDVYGREVKMLLDNKPISATNVLVWNGLNNWGTLERRGTYIIFAQLWHPDGRSVVLKEACHLHYE